MQFRGLFKTPVSFLGFFLLTYFSFCEREKAKPLEIPSTFNRSDIATVISHAKRKYIDPSRVNQDLAYVRAAEAALSNLPYSLLLMTKEYYQNRNKLKPKEKIIPGRTLFLKPEDSYLIFVPNYEEWDKKEKKQDALEKSQSKKLNVKQRRELFSQRRKELLKIRKFKIKSWEKNRFSSYDFSKIMDWLEKNWGKYKELPVAYKKKKKKKKKDTDSYGVHNFYFAAARGFMRSMDPHGNVIPVVSWEKMLSKSEDSTFEGIGALLRGGGSLDVVVETPLQGSPALNSGLKAGDIIRNVDGESIEDLPLSEVVKQIRGPRDTTVILHVERPIELRNLDVTIKRGIIKQLAVTSRTLTSKELTPSLIPEKQKYGLIDINSFLYSKHKTHQIVAKEYKKLLKQNGGSLNGLILDLRGNPGGYLQEAVSVADLFLPSGKTVVIVKGKRGSRTLKTKSKSLVDPKTPLIILLNSGSASASEILASALMDHKRALVLGERSFGKATVQSVETTSVSNVMVKLTSARYYAPLAYTVQVYGILPDIKISDEEDGTFPPRFREEDMWDHLPRLEKKKELPSRRSWVQKIKTIVGLNGKAELYIKNHKRDALKPDFMLLRSIAYLRALKQKGSF